MEGVAVGAGNSSENGLLEQVKSGEKEFTGIKEVDLALVNEYLMEVLQECDFVKLKNGVRFHCCHKNGTKNVVELERLNVETDDVIRAGRCKTCNTIFYVIY